MEIDELSVSELKAKIDNKDTFELIDVREPHEYEICKLEKAELIPLATLESKLVGLDKSKEYIIHCKMGGRSATAVGIMLENGFEHVQNLAGGINAWAREIDTDMPQY